LQNYNYFRKQLVFIMTKIEIEQLSKLYYTIGEVSKMMGVNPSLLRFWEREFNLTVAKKNNKGNRLYAVKEISEINTIYDFVKRQGYTIEGAKKALKGVTSKHSSPENKNQILIDQLEKIKQKLVALKQ
jgi:DNA-binding transcriptional MerR regulator